MQRVTLSFTAQDAHADDTFKVFGNVDAAGRPTGSINYGAAITGPAALPIVPLAQQRNFGGGAWGVGPWGKGPWGRRGTTQDVTRSVQTPRLYFGAYQFAVVAYDGVGNATQDAGSEIEVVVNSGPEPVRRFRLSGVIAGQPVFAFDPPAQLRE